MMNLQELRSLFPHTAHTIYLNHAATAPLSLAVTKALETWMRQRQGEEIDNYFTFSHTVLAARQMIAGLLKVSVNEVDVCPNVSVALNYLAQGLDWQAGDRIAIPACEFPANVWPFLYLREKGVEIDFIPHENGVFTLEAIEKALHPRTRLLTLSWVQFLSGFKAPLAEIGRMTRERGIWFSVDVIQGFGALAWEETEAYGIDFLAGGAQKWMMGDQGTGWFYMRPALRQALKPPMAGWLSGLVDWDNFFDYQFNWHDDATRYRVGTLNNSGIAAMHAALEVYTQFGVEAANERVLSLAAYLGQGLKDLGLSQYGALDMASSSGIVTFSHPNYQGLFDHLTSNKITISVRNKLLRFSPTYYNDRAELDKTLAAVSAFLGR